jgi:hypothetical protein
LSRIRSLREKEGEEGIVWKRVYKGGVMVTKGRGWVRIARTYITRSNYKGEIDELCL